MRSVRRLMVVAATILAFSVLAPSVSAASPKAFHLEKTCASDFLCTVQDPNPGIPLQSRLHLREVLAYEGKQLGVKVRVVLLILDLRKNHDA